MRHRISAGAIVENEGRILLVRYRAARGIRYWVAPGGGAEGTEDLAVAACRETREETGLAVRVRRMLYVEEFHDAVTRYCKVWFAADVAGKAGIRRTRAATAEGIVDVAWLTRREIREATVFPEVLKGRYWRDRGAAHPTVHHLPMHRMTF